MPSSKIILLWYGILKLRFKLYIKINLLHKFENQVSLHDWHVPMETCLVKETGILQIIYWVLSIKVANKKAFQYVAL